MEITFQKASETSQQGDLVSARSMFEALLIESPNDPDCLYSLARIDLKEYKLEIAHHKVQQAIKQDAENISYKLLLAQIYYEQQKFDQLRQICNEILDQDEKTASAYNLLGLLALSERNNKEALEKFFMAMKLETPNIHAMKNYALTLHQVGENILAEKYSRLILKLEPDNLEAKYTLGMSLRCQDKLDEAKAIFESVIELPKAQFNYGHIQLIQNNLEEGLGNYSAWKKVMKPHQDLLKPEWDGLESKNKTLLLVSQQGYGDTILMSRFLSTIKKQFNKIIIKVDKPLIRLIQSIDQKLEVIETLEDQQYDCWCDVMDLPHKLGITHVDQIPQEPWFKFESDADDKGRKIKSSEINVGINWAGNPLFTYDEIRSTHLDTFASLFDLPGINWHSLHKGHLESEAEEYDLKTPLNNAEDFYDTASIMNNLDLVISTETAVPNLSAALNIPTCIISNKDVDWRWDAWYESAEVYRQEIENDWSEPVSRVRKILESMVNLRHSKFALSSYRE